MEKMGKCYFIVIREVGIESAHPWAEANIAISSLWHSGPSQQRTPGCQREARKEGDRARVMDSLKVTQLLVGD